MIKLIYQEYRHGLELIIFLRKDENKVYCYVENIEELEPVFEFYLHDYDDSKHTEEFYKHNMCYIALQVNKKRLSM